MIINLISGPRNVSTALMYSFAQRSDTTVTDEPFYAVYLAKSGALHPGAEAVVRALPSDENVVRSSLMASNTRPVLFVKNMAHHMEVLDDPFITGATNIFLIRDPHLILSSYAAVIAKPVMRDIGVAYQYELFRRLTDAGQEPIVLDSGYLLHEPIAVLTKLCGRCGLAFEQRMAHWPPGPKSYDGVWAPHWYANVHRTTGFTKIAAPARTLPQHLVELYQEAKGFYEKLLPFSLKA
jgi:hypothetical protein